MRLKEILAVAAVATVMLYSSCTKEHYIGVGFYNVENLFDTLDDPKTFDGEFLPDSSRQWNTEKYTTKLNNLATVITSYSGEHPDFLGLCEVENKHVLEDLIKTEKLAPLGYEIIHVESHDARGIDVAALYNPEKLKLVYVGATTVDLSAFDEVTRDIVWAKMTSLYKDETFYFLINHWPSRRGGLETSEPKRIQAASALKRLKDSLLTSDPDANLVIMGDFNDEPTNKSIMTELGALSRPDQISNTQVFNAMAPLKQQGKGTYCFRGNWNMLDQIMVSKNLLDNKTWQYRAQSATIMDFDWLKQSDGDYAGYPLRTFGGRHYLAGYSDHFPVSVILEY